MKTTLMLDGHIHVYTCNIHADKSYLHWKSKKSLGLGTSCTEEHVIKMGGLVWVKAGYMKQMKRHYNANLPVSMDC